MIVEPLPIKDAMRIRLAPQGDQRGYFVRTYCGKTFRGLGLNECSVQTSIAHNSRKGTLRGLHFQSFPHGETKVVLPIQGALFDVIVDLRRDSPTFGQWHGEPLDSRRLVALYIPSGVAHGYLTLEADTRVLYQMDAPMVPEAASGIRWNDPAIGVAWPAEPVILSERDASWPLLPGRLEIS